MENRTSKTEPVQRISISLPTTVFDQLESMLDERGFDNRSQAIAEILQQHISDYYSLKGNRMMAGTITLLYDHRKPGLKQQLSDIQYEHISEVVSSLTVLLESGRTMEVILVQGPAQDLRQITNQFLACKGVYSGRLNLTRTILPPLHPRSEAEKASADAA